MIKIKKCMAITLSLLMILTAVFVTPMSSLAVDTTYKTMVVGETDTSASGMYDSYSASFNITANSTNPSVVSIVIDPKAAHSVTVTAHSVGQAIINIYADGNLAMCYNITVTDGSGSGGNTGGGTVPTGTFVLCHDKGDIGNFGADGTIQYTAASDDYVWVRNYDTGIQYCTDGWQGFVDTVTLVSEKNTTQFNKLYVSKGSHTIRLYDNGNDTYTLTYAENYTPQPTTSNQGGGDTPQPTTGGSTGGGGVLNGKFVLVHDAGDIGFFNENGQIEYTSEMDDDMLWVRNYDTGVQYCTDGWTNRADTVTLVNEHAVTTYFHKMTVPAGKHTYTLIDNGNDTYTLTYAQGYVPPTPTETTPVDDNKTKLLVLGDSIAYGYNLSARDTASYGALIANGKGYSLNNNAVNGHTSANLLSLLTSDSTVIANATNANLVSISIGGNDLLQNMTALISNITANGPDCEFVNTIINNLQSNLNSIVTRIHQLNPNAVIILQTLYNPSAIRVKPGMDFSAMAALIYPKFNMVFSAVAGSNSNVYVADVYTTMANEYAKTQSQDLIQEDGIHPSETGHVVIYNTIISKINELETAGVIPAGNVVVPSTPPAPQPTYLYGDANGDGEVNVKDATAIQKHAAHITLLDSYHQILADVDGSSVVDVKDATQIQKRCAGLINKFPCE